MGNLSYNAGNPTLLGSTWNIAIQAGKCVNKMKPFSQFEIFSTSDIQLANYNVTDISWLFNVLGPDLMYAKAQVWETRRYFSTHYHLLSE